MRPTSNPTWRARASARIGIGLGAIAIAVAATACQPVTATNVPGGGSTNPTPTTSPIKPPVTATAACTTTTTRSITVAATIVNHTRQLLAAAKADGLKLCGGGYRSSASQIAVRKTNCGTTYYDIYQKPASQCSPPTAIPGTSMHEKGLAIDFESCDSHTTACYKWLAKNAATYGFKNLPSEPWHWSTTGG
jgi:LAS superfamily LD-carboxypeptidase LdcB